MRIIPVIDLLGGQAVHAVKGERKNYRPIKSVLCDKPDPVAIAVAFRDKLGLKEIYIADLDAIQSNGGDIHRKTIETLAGREKIDILLDAAVSDVESARSWLNLGVHKIVIGSETLDEWDAIESFPAKIAADRLAFSLDMRAGRILSRCPALAALSAMEALERLHATGWRELILLDLQRVGSETGADAPLAARVRKAFPDLALLIGGGIANPEELADLRDQGIAGALIATALHRGNIGLEHLSA